MVTYSVTVSIDQVTRTYLKGHAYSMYVFKGINAGAGAVSTVWETITGSQLYDQAENKISWTENFYIGETQIQAQNGATITGGNPYTGASSSPAVIQLNRLYTYGDIDWNKNPTEGVNNKSFAIQNKPHKTNNFYVSQHESGKYIVVQSIPGASGIGTFEPVEKIAVILATQSHNTGTLITQTYSPGLIVFLNGESRR